MTEDDPCERDFEKQTETWISLPRPLFHMPPLSSQAWAAACGTASGESAAI